MILTAQARISAQTYEISEEELSLLETTIARQKASLEEQGKELSGLKIELSESKRQIDDLLTKLLKLKESSDAYAREAQRLIQSLREEVKRVKGWAVAGAIISGAALGSGGFIIGRVTK